MPEAYKRFSCNIFQIKGNTSALLGCSELSDTEVAKEERRVSDGKGAKSNRIQKGREDAFLCM